MRHIRILRDRKEVGNVLLDARIKGITDSDEEILSNWDEAFKLYDQIAYCVETGDFLAVVDKQGYLQVVLPEHRTINPGVALK